MASRCFASPRVSGGVIAASNSATACSASPACVRLSHVVATTAACEIHNKNTGYLKRSAAQCTVCAHPLPERLPFSTLPRLKPPTLEQRPCLCSPPRLIEQRRHLHRQGVAGGHQRGVRLQGCQAVVGGVAEALAELVVLVQQAAIGGGGGTGCFIGLQGSCRVLLRLCMYTCTWSTHGQRMVVNA